MPALSEPSTGKTVRLSLSFLTLFLVGSTPASFAPAGKFTNGVFLHDASSLSSERSGS